MGRILLFTILIKSGFMKKLVFGVYADSEGPDQPAHMRRMVRVFAVRFQAHWML